MNNVEKGLLRGMEQAVEYAKGKRKGSKTHYIFIPGEIDIRALRKQLQMTRIEFAHRFGFNYRTLEKWELGTRHPSRETRAYLTVIEKIPKAVEEAIKQLQQDGPVCASA